jgi:acetyl-CoA carboxylase/biotin carboxylase 1
MIMPLVASEDGIAQFIKQPGVTLEAGDILGILSLDDPSRVQHAKPFDGQLPSLGLPNIVGTKAHQRFAYLKEILANILAGYDNQSIMLPTIKELVAVLRDPELPYGEANAVLSTLSGRLPAKLENSLRQTIDNAHANAAAEFPSARLRKLVDATLETLRPSERTAFQLSLAALDDVIDRYRSGLKLHEWLTLASIMAAYHETEFMFSGREDDVVLELRETHREELDTVVKLVLSHYKAASKNSLILALLELVKESDSLAVVESTFSNVLKDLAELDSKSTTKVALKAREVLIHCQLPSLDERLVQLEQILKASVTQTVYGETGPVNRSPRPEVLKDVVDSRFTVFDVLPAFFQHSDSWVGLAALETYVRRAYKSYNIINIDHIEGDKSEAEPATIAWSFRMRKASSESEPVTPTSGLTSQRTASYSDLTFLLSRGQEEPIRYGTMFSITSLANFREELATTLRHYPDMAEGKLQPQASSQTQWNVCNVAISAPTSTTIAEEDALRAQFAEHVNAMSEQIERRGMRRLTLLICREGHYPSYLTLRKQDGVWKEISTIRDIEPALAYQLELARLSNFTLTPCPTENRQVHIYYAVGKGNSSDCRFFVRALVRPGRLRGNMKTADYLVSESDRLVTDVLDTLEVVSASRRAADGNHISVRPVHLRAKPSADVLTPLTLLSSLTSSTVFVSTLRRFRPHSQGSSTDTASASGVCASPAPRSGSSSRTRRATFNRFAPSSRTTLGSSSSTRPTARLRPTRASLSSNRSVPRAPSTSSRSTFPIRRRSGFNRSATRPTSSERPTPTTSPTSSVRQSASSGRRSARRRRRNPSSRRNSFSMSSTSRRRSLVRQERTTSAWSDGSTRSTRPSTPEDVASS